MLRWRHRKFAVVHEWVARQWDYPEVAAPGVGLLVHYLMAIRMDIAGARGERATLDDVRIPFGPQPPGDEWLPEEVDEEDPAATTPVEQEVRIPISPRIVAAGGLVRIKQPDGSLRMYDVNKGRYVE